MIEIPPHVKPFLTLEEAVSYFNIGEHKMRQIGKAEPGLTVHINTKVLYVREKITPYILAMYADG